MLTENTKQVYHPKREGPIKVAFFSNGPELPTGYAKVIREITTRLDKDKDFEVYIINENHFSPNTYEWQGIPVHGVNVPMTSQGPDRSKMAEKVYEETQKIQPDILVMLEDSFTLHNFQFERLYKTNFKKIFYMPLDGDWIPETGLKVVRTMDCIVAMSEFTHNSLKKEGFDSETIWHGVDLELFKPVSNQKQAALKQKYGFDKDDFVIYNYGRNSNIRKNNHALLWIMAKYLKNAPDNHKFLFHTLKPDYEGNNLFDYVDRHLTIEHGEDAVDNIYFSPFDQQNPAEDYQMAEMIQMSDLVVTASSGEGFGLIMAEAMACAKPIISTDYTTPEELLVDESKGVGPRGIVVPPEATNVASLNTEHAFVDKDIFVQEIENLVNDEDKMRELGMNGRYFAEKYLNWEYLVDEWKTLLKEQA